MHRTTPDFWRLYHLLPDSVQRTADRCYQSLRSSPVHPSLRMKRVGDYWSVRVGKHHRALGVDSTDGILWYWIGRHDQYEKEIATQ